ncbi:hypothetical protein ACGFZL_26780 [Streptomyces sp. NPDC048182]|uniref:hypothetical protein n=1 Tax=Streptomyces sp. NPDC048182 TaxID=3365507 RepID=UPI003719CA5F
MQFSDPHTGHAGSGRLLAMAIAQLHAVAAVAGCSLSQPFPDNGIDWHVSHSAPGHTVDDEVTIKVQLKVTYQVRIPTARIFDDRALCEIMTRVGTGGTP